MRSIGQLGDGLKHVVTSYGSPSQPIEMGEVIEVPDLLGQIAIGRISIG